MPQYRLGLDWLATTFALLIALAGCTPLIAPYSAKAYENATSLKAQTLALMDKSDEPYSRHSGEIEGPNGHTAKLNAAYEYVAGLDNNSISARQWRILIDKNGKLYGKFISRWQDDGVLREAFITEFKKQVSDAFDEIICLETNKKESKKCSEVTGE